MNQHLNDFQFWEIPFFYQFQLIDITCEISNPTSEVQKLRREWVSSESLSTMHFYFRLVFGWHSVSKANGTRKNYESRWSKFQWNLCLNHWIIITKMVAQSKKKNEVEENMSPIEVEWAVEKDTKQEKHWLLTMNDAHKTAPNGISVNFTERWCDIKILILMMNLSREVELEFSHDCNYEWGQHWNIESEMKQK